MNKGKEDKETLARLQHYIESLLRAELYMGPALDWVDEQKTKGDTTFKGAGTHGVECYHKLILFRLELEAKLAKWRASAV